MPLFGDKNKKALTQYANAAFNRKTCRLDNPKTVAASSVVGLPASSQPSTCARFCRVMFNVIVSPIG